VGPTGAQIPWQPCGTHGEKLRVVAPGLGVDAVGVDELHLGQVHAVVVGLQDLLELQGTGERYEYMYGY